MQLLRDKMKQPPAGTVRRAMGALIALAAILPLGCGKTGAEKHPKEQPPPRKQPPDQYGQVSNLPQRATPPPASAKRPRFPDPPWTVQKIVDAFGGITRRKFEGACRSRGIPWPPARLAFLAFKRERSLEIWGSGPSGAYGMIGRYPILAASGGPGPKRMEGDRQVPEGFYTLPELNPNSSLHLSIRIGYPNRDDIDNSHIPQDAMGGDIYLHGKAVSIGCIAVGDPAIEEIFTLAALVSEPDRRIIISPVDFRRTPKPSLPREEKWVSDLYARLRGALAAFPVATPGRRH